MDLISKAGKVATTAMTAVMTMATIAMILVMTWTPRSDKTRHYE